MVRRREANAPVKQLFVTSHAVLDVTCLMGLKTRRASKLDLRHTHVSLVENSRGWEPVREAGNPPLLRLVATYPHETNIGELAGTVKQPVAVVNMTRLRDYAESYTVDDIVRRLSTVMSAPRPVNAPKRKRADSPNLDDDAEALFYHTRAVTKKMGALEGRADGNARPRAGPSRIAKERKAAPKKSPAPPPRKAPAPSGRGLKRGQNRR